MERWEKTGEGGWSELENRLRESLPHKFPWRILELKPNPAIIMIDGDMSATFEIYSNGKQDKVRRRSFSSGNDGRLPLHRQHELERHAATILRVLKKELEKNNSPLSEPETNSEEQQEFHFETKRH